MYYSRESEADAASSGSDSQSLGLVRSLFLHFVTVSSIAVLMGKEISPDSWETDQRVRVVNGKAPR